MFQYIKERLQYANHLRLDRRKLRKIQKDDIEPRKVPLTLKEPIKRILFVSTSIGLGDILYLTGLFKALTEDGYIVDVAVPERAFSRFIKLPFIENCFYLGDVLACNEELKRNPDILIDLTWVSIKNWDERSYILKKAECFKLTTSTLCKNLNIFDAHIDYESISHISKRLAAVRSFITGKNSLPIKPFILLPEDSKKSADAFIQTIHESGKKLLFLNGIAGDDDRCLSDNQIGAILKELEKFQDVKVLINKRLFKIFNQNNQIIELPETSFMDFCAILCHCDVIISVDTSVVHVASAFNTPVIAIFSPNDRDYYSQHSQSSVWAPISDISMVENFDDPELTVSQWGLTNRKMRHMNTIPSVELAQRIGQDLRKIFVV